MAHQMLGVLQLSPFTLLIPVVGFFSTAVFLGEDLPPWKFLASLFIMGGLVFGLLEKKIRGLLQTLVLKKQDK